MSTHQLAFINDNVNNWEALAANLPNDVTVVHLDSQRDGLHQIVDYLHDQSIQNLAAIHLLSHGASGQVQLGNLTLTQDNLATQHDLLSQLGQALSEQGDLLLYGCEVGAGEAGQALVHSIAAMTHADVAASNNLTGAAARGGDWALETQAGVINAASLAVDNYTGTLAVVSFTGDAGNTNSPDATVASGSAKTSVAITNTATSDTLDIAINGGTGVYQDTTGVFTGFGMAVPVGSSSMVFVTADDTNINSVTLTVQGGKVFDFVSMLMMEKGGVSEVMTFTPNGNPANKVTKNFAGGQTQTVDLSANTNFDNLTSLTISSNDGAFQINFDDIQLENIGGSNTPPTITSGASGSVAENAATSTVVYTTTVTDPESDAITYALTGTDAAAFDISTTGAVTLKASADYETKSSYSIIVNASDAAHTASPTTKNVTINVSNVNEAPTAANFTSAGLNATTAIANATAGTLAAVDPDASDTHTFTLVAGNGTNDADNSKFTITGSTLKVGGTPLAAGTYHVMTRATDAGNLSFDQAQTITIGAPNAKPVFGSGSSGSVAENAATSTVVYSAIATDAEHDAITYALTGTDAAAFDISTTGAVTLKASADYETKSSYSIIVNASDAAHTASPTTKNVTINVSNVNEKPVITAPASQSIKQGWSTRLTGLGVFDPDSGSNPITVSLSTPAGRFYTVSLGGVTVAGNNTNSMTLTGTQANINNFINDSAMLGIDYIPTDTTGNVITGTVTLSITSDDGGSTGSGGTQTDSKTETVNIVPPNAAPIITSGVTGSVAENAPTNTVVYTATATDAENDAITYLLTGTDAAAFNVSVTGDITLKASADYETKPSYSITVNAKDADNTTRKTIDVNVTNVNDAPTDISLSPNRVVENTATTNALSIGTLTTIDQDAGDTFTYSIVGGADQASFQITGTDLQFKAGTTLDYETKSSYAVTVRSTDQGGLTYDKTLTINLTNVNEAPTAINFTSAGLDATTATANATAGALAAVDPDTGNTHTFTLVAGSGTNDADNSKFTITGSTLKVGGTPLAAGIYHVMTRATDAGGLSFDQAQTITITNPPPAPVLTPAPQIIDGVALQTLTTSNGGQQITIPLVSADRSEDKTTANSHLADIPLAKNTAGTTILNLGIPTGVGAIVSGTSSSISLGEAKNELIRQIEAKTTQDSDSRSSMSTDGLQFLSALTSSDTLRVQTITPSVDKTTQTITTPIVITATPQIDGSKQAIVLDTQQLPSKTPITVNNIDFISVVGSARITGGAGANIAVGDNEDQFIVLGADDDELHGGGGTDTIGSLTGNDKLYGDGGNDVVYGGTGNDTLDGGSGNNVLNGGFGQDTALLAGTLADYQVTLINSNQIQLTHRTTGATNTLIDIETVTFIGNQETWQLTYTPGKTQITQDHVANVSANRNIVTDLLTTQGDDRGYVSMGLALSIDAKAGFDVLNMTGSRSDINYRLTGLEFPELVEFYKQHPTTDLPTPTSLEITRLTDGAMLDLKNVDFIAFDNGDAIAIAHNHTETIIGRLFHTLLNRDPAAHEWQLAQQASTAYQQGSLSAATILNWFTAQNPTLNQQNNSAYLQTLYQQTFGRDPSTAELTTALQTLDNASTSRDAIAVTIAASNEALSSIDNLITAYQWL